MSYENIKIEKGLYTTCLLYTSLKAIVTDVNVWSSENPYLYTMVITLKDNGMPIAYISKKIGFRNVEIKDGIIRICLLYTSRCV